MSSTLLRNSSMCCWSSWFNTILRRDCILRSTIQFVCFSVTFLNWFRSCSMRRSSSSSFSVSSLYLCSCVRARSASYVSVTFESRQHSSGMRDTGEVIRVSTLSNWKRRDILVLRTRIVTYVSFNSCIIPNTFILVDLYTWYSPSSGRAIASFWSARCLGWTFAMVLPTTPRWFESDPVTLTL